ncbi:sensor histidine kinase [Aurantiacibacter spongiae]|uniref:histidine kinase n=1 Tax=Aurantiacibacter spongiae TaxID=2488860 RepID=A0A3N5DJZ0_9SPHN|nr:histidine kinase dimerization/phosphoacceptor domain -containing protein [Aurantiacibacter spongiae]RPF71055.1 DUF4118 domain-containing protein [Aurantiacibacter spongiae]
MKRLASFDVSRRFARGSSRHLVEILFGVLAALAMIALRSLLDTVAALAGPFALVYPAVLIATLYGHWRGGLTAFTIAFLYAWYFVLPAPQSFQFEVATDPSRVAINAASALVVVVFAEGFRRAVRTAMAERDEEIERRIVLMQELEHRTKNNFALAASLLEMQKRRAGSQEVENALDTAIARIHSFAGAYANLAQTQGEGARVAMRDYLEDVVDRVGAGAFHDGITVNVEAANIYMPREIAVAIGLFTNEALTNCAKYAFPDDRKGRVEVAFRGRADDWTLEISDDGVGIAGAPDALRGKDGGGVGTRLMDAFARQACATSDISLTDGGCRLVLASADGA